MSNTGVITTKGLSIVSGRLIGTTPIQTEPNNMGVGTGSSGALTSDETLSDPSTYTTRVVGTSSQTTTNTTDDTYTVVATLVCSNPDGEEWTNIALFDTSVSAPTTTLADQCLTTDEQITVVSSSGFPVQSSTGDFDIQILTEVMTVTSQSANVWQVTRATNGSSKISSTIAATTPVVGGSGTTGGNLFTKVSFGSGYGLNNGDSLTYTINLVA